MSCVLFTLPGDSGISVFGCLMWNNRNNKSYSSHFLRPTGRVPEKHLPLLYWLHQRLCVDRNKLWKILQEMGIPDHLTCLLRNLYAGHEATELDTVQQTGSKSGKECIKSVYCHRDYLTYTQTTSWEMLGWMKHKLESKLLGEISMTSGRQMTSPLWQKENKN